MAHDGLSKALCMLAGGLKKAKGDEMEVLTFLCLQYLKIRSVHNSICFSRVSLTGCSLQTFTDLGP